MMKCIVIGYLRGTCTSVEMLKGYSHITYSTYRGKKTLNEVLEAFCYFLNPHRNFPTVCSAVI